MILTFGKLQELSSSIENNDFGPLYDWFNNVKGENVYEKFINILKIWEYNISDTLDINIEGKSFKIQISYLLGEFPEVLDSQKEIEVGNFNFKLDIPKKFNINFDLFPIYDLIHEVKLATFSMGVSPHSVEWKTVIDNLPAKVYSKILEEIVHNKNNTISFSNPALAKLRLNFNTNDPHQFLCGLLSNYDRQYFRGILYHLSKRVHPDVIMSSNIKDIEYYIDEYQKEVKEQSKGVDI